MSVICVGASLGQETRCVRQTLGGKGCIVDSSPVALSSRGLHCLFRITERGGIILVRQAALICLQTFGRLM